MLNIIAQPLAELQPEMAAEDRAVRARTLFGAVHGIINITIEALFVGLPPEWLERDLDEIIIMIAVVA